MFLKFLSMTYIFTLNICFIILEILKAFLRVSLKKNAPYHDTFNPYIGKDFKKQFRVHLSIFLLIKKIKSMNILRIKYR
jgi:hypothetical protein